MPGEVQLRNYSISNFQAPPLRLATTPERGESEARNSEDSGMILFASSVT